LDRTRPVVAKCEDILKDLRGQGFFEFFHFIVQPNSSEINSFSTTIKFTKKEAATSSIDLIYPVNLPIDWSKVIATLKLAMSSIFFL
jgi:hypothetical protein